MSLRTCKIYGYRSHRSQKRCGWPNGYWNFLVFAWKCAVITFVSEIIQRYFQGLFWRAIIWFDISKTFAKIHRFLDNTSERKAIIFWANLFIFPSTLSLIEPTCRRTGTSSECTEIDVVSFHFQEMQSPRISMKLHHPVHSLAVLRNH